LACALSACAAHSSPEQPATPPHKIAAEVVQSIESAAATLNTDAAAEEWTVAHDRFEVDLEPLLRARYTDNQVAELEYAFGRVHARLGTGDADEAARQLGERLAVMVAELPPQT
jgi:hypothetical protein